MSRALITLDPAPIAAPRRPLDIGSYEFEIDDGVICCGSDQHYRPGEPPSTAHRAFVQTVSRFAEEGTLKAVVLGGDAFDFPAISKHPRIMWEERPSVAAEIAVVRSRMEEIKSVAGLDCKLIFIMGNHDQRLSTRSALLAPSWKASTARTYATAWTRIGRFAGKLSRTAPGSTRSSSVIAISRVTAPGAITSSPPAAAWSRATLII